LSPKRRLVLVLLIIGVLVMPRPGGAVERLGLDMPFDDIENTQVNATGGGEGDVEDTRDYNVTSNRNLTNYNLTSNLNLTIESVFGQIRVIDKNGARHLYLAKSLMSYASLSNIHDGRGARTDCMEAVSVINPENNAVLSIGLAGGSFEKRMHNGRGFFVDAVEIDETLLDVAKKYFAVKPSETFRVFVGDGRMVLKNTERKYDVISIDAFKYDPLTGATRIPFHLATQEFFAIAKRHLNPGGVLIMNVFIPSDIMLSSEYKTMKTIFKQVHVLDCGPRIIIGTDSPLYNSERLDADTPGKILEIDANRRGSVLLTDDYAPMNSFYELLVM